MSGTEDAKVFAIPNPGLRLLNCSYSFKGEGTVAATMFLRMLQNICYPVSDGFVLDLFILEYCVRTFDFCFRNSSVIKFIVRYRQTVKVSQLRSGRDRALPI